MTKSGTIDAPIAFSEQTEEMVCMQVFELKSDEHGAFVIVFRCQLDWEWDVLEGGVYVVA